MILNNIEVENLSFPNIFLTKSKELEVIDMVFDIYYEVDEDSFNLDEYDVTSRDLEKKTLEEMAECYMVVPLECDTYKRINTISHNNLEYLIFSEGIFRIDEYNQFVSDSQKEKAFNMIKEYIKSDKFKDELVLTLANGKQIF